MRIRRIKRIELKRIEFLERWGKDYRAPLKEEMI